MVMGGREGRKYRMGGCGLYSGYICVRFVLGLCWFVWVRSVMVVHMVYDIVLGGSVC